MRQDRWLILDIEKANFSARWTRIPLLEGRTQHKDSSGSTRPRGDQPLQELAPDGVHQDMKRN